ncbi:hypothetical protein DFS34DRAFT_630108 [Phlyctochytrium arcticum]|nr:hypothetical protein DFS34DRAFT_630108 [Phlyctochytrium arcticum]
MLWYHIVGACMAGNVMRPGVHGYDEDALKSYTWHGMLVYALWMYLRFFGGETAQNALLVGFGTVVFTWIALSYGLGLYQIHRGNTKMDEERTTRAWNQGPHLTPNLRGLREGLSHFLGFATAFGATEPKYMAMFVVGMIGVTFAFCKVEEMKEIERAELRQKAAEQAAKDQAEGKTTSPATEGDKKAEWDKKGDKNSGKKKEGKKNK